MVNWLRLPLWQFHQHECLEREKKSPSRIVAHKLHCYVFLQEVVNSGLIYFSSAQFFRRH